MYIQIYCIIYLKDLEQMKRVMKCKCKCRMINLDKYK